MEEATRTARSNAGHVTGRTWWRQHRRRDTAVSVLAQGGRARPAPQLARQRHRCCGPNRKSGLREAPGRGGHADLPRVEGRRQCVRRGKTRRCPLRAPFWRGTGITRQGAERSAGLNLPRARSGDRAGRERGEHSPTEPDSARRAPSVLTLPAQLAARIKPGRRRSPLSGSGRFRFQVSRRRPGRHRRGGGEPASLPRRPGLLDLPDGDGEGARGLYFVGIRGSRRDR